MTVLDILLGRRLANREAGLRKIGAVEGVAAMGLDGLGSSAYGPEAALTILTPLGAAGLGQIGWIMAVILLLLALLTASYWQTIAAYPNNGGAYVVTRENLGSRWSLLAAAGLMTDYVLNTAVGISAGIGALISAVPTLHPWTLPLCLGVLAILTLVNLRGTQEAGRLLAVPTYLFILSFGAIIALGLWQAVGSGGQPAVIVPPARPGPATETAGLWLLLRAFAAGCTAMTGVEAVSNGMNAFYDPKVTHGRRTLLGIVLTLGLLLAGIACLAMVYGIPAMDQTRPGYRSVLAQLAGAVIGEGPFYYVAIGALLAVLALSANTSFVGFPRLCRMVAEDGFLPKTFAMAGRRLVFTAGILYLAGAAGVLLVVFGGITDRLIPLFAIGAFLTFTLSQAGMAAHWRKALHRAGSGREKRRHRLHLAINAAGATATALALAIIIVAKFAEGAWITLFVIPLVILLLRLVRRYYDRLAGALRIAAPLAPRREPPVVLVAVEDWNKPTDKAIRLAMSLSDDIVGFHLTHLAGPEAEEHHKALQARWSQGVAQPAEAAGLTPPRLMILPAQYRMIDEPVLKLADGLEEKFPGRPIVLLLPEIVKQRWYQYLLHAFRADRLRAKLMSRDTQLTVVTVPWRLGDRARDGRDARPTGG